MKTLLSWFKRLILVALAIMIGLFTIGYIQYRVLISQSPLSEMMETARSKPTYVTIEKIDSFYLETVVAVEDKRFYQRSGFDFRAFGRAMMTNITTLSLAQGGSTIPQQVAKNLYFDYRTNLMRKIIEIYLLYDLEAQYSKDEILEMYVNIIYFGDGYTGIARATTGYFNTTPEVLSKGQATLLAGLPQSPSRFQLSNHFQRAKARQKIVLSMLADQGLISEEEAEQIFKEDVYVTN